MVMGVVLAALFGVLCAFVGLTVGALELVMFVVLPVAVVGSLLMRLIGGRSRRYDYV